MAHCTLLGMGNPLLDISAEISDTAILTKYGLKMGNAILAGPEHAGLYDELVATYGDKVVYVAGGATQNSVRVAQWMSGAPAGWAAYVGCVGADAYGATLAKCAEADGVAVLYQVTAAAPTGTCAVLVHDTERSMCANLAASEALSPEHADSPAVAAAIASAKVVYNAGFPLTHAGGAAIAERLAKACAKSGAVYATNLSAPFLCQVRRRRHAPASGGAASSAACGGVARADAPSLPTRRAATRRRRGAAAAPAPPAAGPPRRGPPPRARRAPVFPRPPHAPTSV